MKAIALGFMLKFVSIFFFGLLTLEGLAQNLVPNPSFEEVDSLPCWFISGHDGEPVLEDYLIYWTAPTGGTSDLYSMLLSDSCYVNPTRLGIQPRSGNNMIGIITVEGSDNYREYVQVKLNSALVVGKNYYAEMYVLRNTELDMASNNLGIYFSGEQIEESKRYREVLDFNPQILEKEVITNNWQWQKVSGCFVAESSAEYLLIGNFFSSAETASNVLSNAGGLIAYYFIDDVRVEEVDVQLANRLGNDTTLCAGETMVLDAFVEGATYQWDDFSTEPTLTVEVGDVYWVDITLGDCIYRDSITVIYEPSIFLGKDTLLCFGESLILGTEDMMREYQWSDGSAGSTLEVNEPGVYWVTLPSENCLISDTIVVDYLDCPGMIPNVFTPGNDDANETFYIENIGNREWQLRIFNRWGKEVYFSDNYQNDWTGENLSSGVYFYYLTSPILEREYKGWVHLMREHTMLTKNK